MGVQAFTQLGNTVAFTATTTAPAAVQASSLTLGGNQYRVINDGNVTAHLAYGATAAIASNNAVIASGGGANSAFSLPLLSGTDEILTFLPNAFFTAITSSGNAAIYITPGDGV